MQSVQVWEGGRAMDRRRDAVTVGLDFGTLSVRALCVRVSDGEELGAASVPYEHGVMDAVLSAPSGEIPPPDFPSRTSTSLSPGRSSTG